MQDRSTLDTVAGLAWDEIQLILTVATAGSFRAAATVLSSHAVSVGRRVSAIEDRVGRKLFVRTPGGVELTERFRPLLKESRFIEQGIDRFQQTFALALQGAALVREPVHIACSELLFPLILSLGSHDELAISDRIDTHFIVREAPPRATSREADIYLTLQPPTDPAVVTSRIGTYGLGLAASPRYLQDFGRPMSLDDLADHRLVISEELLAIPALAPIATVVARHKGPIMRLPSASLCSTAIRQSCGIGIMARWTSVFNPVNMDYMPTLYEAQCEVWLSCLEQVREKPAVRMALEHIRIIVGQKAEIARERGAQLAFGVGAVVENPMISQLFSDR